MLTYVLSDVHGFFNEYLVCLQRIKSHAQNNEYRIIVLGDYVDKGPNPTSVIYQSWLSLQEGPNVFLKGNHDWWLERWLRGGNVEMSAERLLTIEKLRIDFATQNYIAENGTHSRPNLIMSFFENLRYSFEDELGNKYVHAFYTPKLDAEENPKKKTLMIFGPTNSAVMEMNANGVMTPDRKEWYKNYDGRYGHVYFGHYNLGQYNEGNPTFFPHATCVDCCVSVTGKIKAVCVQTKEII